MISQFESHLWEPANFLRSPGVLADFKTYIFPFIFFTQMGGVSGKDVAVISSDAASRRIS